MILVSRQPEPVRGCLAPRVRRRAPVGTWTPLAWALTLALITSFSLTSFSAAADYEQLDSLLDLDPKSAWKPPEVHFEYELKDVWIRALEAPEADLRRRAAESFVRARREGFDGFDEAIPRLEKRLAMPDPHPQVRLALARALCALDARRTAPLLVEELQRDGLRASVMIEPTLARWNFEPMYAVWRERLADPTTARRYYMLAVECLGVVRDAQSETTLRGLVTDKAQPADVRLVAARALAQIRPAGLESLSQQLAEAGSADSESAGVLDRMLAAELLLHHEDPAAMDQLLKLALDDEPAVADRALEALFRVVPERIRPLAEQLLSSRDSNLRRWATKAIALEPNATHLGMLQQRLVDSHPEIRVIARDALLEFATQAGMQEEVIAAAVETLGGDDWRGLEQAARIAAQLDHKPAAARLMELLVHPRDEVGVTAAWGIRKLSVPETLDPCLAYCERANQQLREGAAGAPLPGAVPLRMAQLIQHFGVQRFSKAEPLLRQLVPKAPYPIEPRAASVWSLGYLHEGQAPSDLGVAFAGRLSDVGSSPPEHGRVRQMAAVSLGRMKSMDQVDVLREFYKLEGTGSEVGAACAWAIEQLTGEKLPPPDPLVRYPQGWFLKRYYDE